MMKVMSVKSMEIIVHTQMILKEQVQFAMHTANKNNNGRNYKIMTMFKFGEELYLARESMSR